MEYNKVKIKNIQSNFISMTDYVKMLTVQYLQLMLNFAVWNTKVHIVIVVWSMWTLWPV